MDSRYDAVIFTSTHAAASSFTSLISLSINILTIIAMWKIFSKAGIAGWKALIPFYNGYLQYKLAWKGSIFWLFFGLVFAGAVFSAVLMVLGEGYMILGTLLFLPILLFALIIQIKLCSRLAKAFGKSTGFAVGLFFLSAIFFCILAFDKSEYQGPQA